MSRAETGRRAGKRRENEGGAVRKSYCVKGMTERVAVRGTVDGGGWGSVVAEREHVVFVCVCVRAKPGSSFKLVYTLPHPKPNE